MKPGNLSSFFEKVLNPAKQYALKDKRELIFRISRLILASLSREAFSCHKRREDEVNGKST